VFAIGASSPPSHEAGIGVAILAASVVAACVFGGSIVGAIIGHSDHYKFSESATISGEDQKEIDSLFYTTNSRK
jgi:hypothetical protein